MVLPERPRKRSSPAASQSSSRRWLAVVPCGAGDDVSADEDFAGGVRRTSRPGRARPTVPRPMWKR